LRTKVISRNQVRAGLWLAHAWFKNISNSFIDFDAHFILHYLSFNSTYKKLEG